MNKDSFESMVSKYKSELATYAKMSGQNTVKAVMEPVRQTMEQEAELATGNSGTKYVVGYYPGYSAYSGFTVDKIKSSKLTHINYAFAKIGDDLTVQLSDPNIDLKNFEALKQLKQKYPNIKTLISVGGWDYSKLFSDAAVSFDSRAKFAQSAVDLMLKYGFDGIDIDWEYPVQGGIKGIKHRPEDKQNFTLLLKAIRIRLDEQGEKDNKKYLLTIAGAPTTDYVNNIEVLKVADLLDYIFIMAYDLHGPWDNYSDFNAPLFNPEGEPPQYKASVNEGVLAYLNKGVSPQKLVLGMPMYGYLYRGVSSKNNGLYSTFDSGKPISFDNVLANYLGVSPYKDFFEVTAKVPYIYGNNTFISYDDRVSIKDKVKYAIEKNLLGVGAWELAQDKQGFLIDAAYNTLYK